MTARRIYLAGPDVFLPDAHAAAAPGYQPGRAGHVPPFG